VGEDVEIAVAGAEYLVTLQRHVELLQPLVAVGKGTVASLIKAGVSDVAIRGTASWTAPHLRTILRKPKQLVHRHFVIRPPLRTVNQHAYFAASRIPRMCLLTQLTLSFQMMVLMKMTNVLLRLLSLLMSTLFLFFANHLLAHHLFVASQFCDCLLALSRRISMSTMPTDVLFTLYHLSLHTIANIFELGLRCVTSLF